MKPRTTHKCKNCGKQVQTWHVRAMMDAGFSIKQIACPHCGQHEIYQSGGEK